MRNIGLTDQNKVQNLYEQMLVAKQERTVERILLNYFSSLESDVKIDFPYRSDGLVRLSENSILCEFKYKQNIENPAIMARVLLQIIYYLKKIEEGYVVRDFPNFIFVATKNQYSLIHVNTIHEYLSEYYDFDFDVAPSQACTRNELLLQELTLFVAKNVIVHNFNNDTENNISNILQEYRMEPIKPRLWACSIQEVCYELKVMGVAEEDFSSLFRFVFMDEEHNYAATSKTKSKILGQAEARLLEIYKDVEIGVIKKVLNKVHNIYDPNIIESECKHNVNHIRRNYKRKTLLEKLNEDIDKTKYFRPKFQLSSPLKAKTSGSGWTVENSYGSLFIEKNIKTKRSNENIKIFSHACCLSNSYPITNDNIDIVFLNFALERCIKNTLTIVYHPDNLHSEDLKKLYAKSYILGSFDVKSAQSSLRNIIVGNEEFKVDNQLFFLERSEFVPIMNGTVNSIVENDFKSNSFDPIVANRIKKYKNYMSPAAIDVYNKAIHITKLTYGKRFDFNVIYPKYQVNNWDAGWFQIKQIAKFYYKEELNDFNILLDILRNEIKEDAYNMGFID